MPTNPGSNFSQKFRDYIATRNGPDNLSRVALILAVIFLIIAIITTGAVRSVTLVIGIAALIYTYFRLFSKDVTARRRENDAYLAKTANLRSKLSGVNSSFKQASDAGAKAARQATRQAKDREHRYFACPKCGQQVRVPKGAGKIRVTCPKCGEKFERKA